MKLWGPLTVWSGGQAVRTTRKLDIQVRAVCGPCNHGWLNDLETEFRDLMTPALHGLPVLLDRAGQNVVARWGIKTWLLLESALSHQRGGGVASPDALAHIRTDKEPPWGYQVWLGQVDAQSRQIMWLSTVPIFRRQGEEIPIGIMAVFTVGNLLFLIYAPVKEPPLDDEQEAGSGQTEGATPQSHVTVTFAFARSAATAALAYASTYASSNDVVSAGGAAGVNVTS